MPPVALVPARLARLPLAGARSAANPHSQDEVLCAAGLPLNAEMPGGRVHHKLSVIDGGGADPRVITGSCKRTAGGAETDDEHTLITHDAATAQAHYQEHCGCTGPSHRMPCAAGTRPRRAAPAAIARTAALAGECAGFRRSGRQWRRGHTEGESRDGRSQKRAGDCLKICGALHVWQAATSMLYSAASQLPLATKYPPAPAWPRVPVWW
jgi:hypothetical protein